MRIDLIRKGLLTVPLLIGLLTIGFLDSTWSQTAGLVSLQPDTVSAQQDDARYVELGVLRGAPEIDPALKYLFDSYVNRPVKQNAAFHYQRAMRRLTELDRSPTRDEYPWETDWLSLELEELPQAKVKEFLEKSQSVVEELEIASRCTFCEWYIDIGSQPTLSTFINVSLDDMQETRRLARYLIVKTRYELLQRDFDAAADALRATYQLSHHVQQYPLIISGLIGGALHGIADAEVANWIKVEGSPNLYWALASLREPPIDLTRGLLGEMRLFTEGIEAFNEPENKNWSPDQWADSLAADFQAVFNVTGQRETEALTSRLTVSGMLLRGYPIAKRALLEEGYTVERLEAMPVAQVVCIHQSLVNRRILHDQLKWQFIRTAEGTRRLAEQSAIHNKAMAQLGASPISLYFLPALMPSFEVVRNAEVRLNREVDALKTLEAIRMHVAETGEPPKSLAEIEIVPLPLDIKTGEFFEYRLSDDTVEVAIPDWLGVNGPSKVFRWKRP